MTNSNHWSAKVAFMAAFFIFATQSFAQWQVPDHSVPVGRGSGTGFKSAAPGASGTVLTSNGSSADPTFQAAPSTLPNGSVNQIPVYTGSTNVTAPTSATNWFDAAFCNSVGYIVVRTTGAWVCSAGTPANVKWWGVKCDGVTDDSANFATAIAATAAANAALYFPGGTCVINNQTIPVAATIIGNNKIHTVISTTSASATIFDISSFTTISDLTFSSSITRTSGTYINITGSNNEIRNVSCSAAFTCLTTGASATTLYIDTLISSGVVSTSGNDFLINGCLDCHFYMLYAINGPSPIPFSHIQIYSTGDLTCVDCSFLGAGTNVYIAPGNGQLVANVSFIGGFTDGAAIIGVNVVPTGTGRVANLNFTRHWISGEGALPVGANIAPVGTSQVSGINFNDTDFFNNSTSVGATTSGGGSVSFISVKNSKISGGNLGVSLVGVQHCDVSGNAIGTVALGSATTDGISLSSTTDYCVLINNDLSTVSGAKITNSSSGSNNRFEGNLGYNPQGSSILTVGASPWTYTAGPTPETLYMSATGGIATISENGGPILPAALGANVPFTISLPPNGTTTISYTGTLTATRMRQ